MAHGLVGSHEVDTSTGAGDSPLFPQSFRSWKKGTVPFSVDGEFCHGLLTVAIAIAAGTRVERAVVRHAPGFVSACVLDQ